MTHDMCNSITIFGSILHTTIQLSYRGPLRVFSRYDLCCGAVILATSIWSSLHIMSDFPWITTTILEVHKDEVWNVQWSHDGAYLASASLDKSAIIWRRGVSVICPSGEHGDETNVIVFYTSHPLIPAHRHHKIGLHIIFCLAIHTPLHVWPGHLMIPFFSQARSTWLNFGTRRWTLFTDVTYLINLSHHWILKTGVCTRTLDFHTEAVTAISWLPDGSGFISGSLDRKIIIWVS
jgi:WD40 repeat protein